MHTRRVGGLGIRDLVGRVGELAELTAALDDACAGKGSLVVISGEAGIGKTRLCQELSSVASGRGMSVAWATCWESAGLPAFWPWGQLFEQLGEPMPAGIDLESGSGSAVARAGMFASMAQTLQRLARDRPRLLVVDDVQWADQGTTRLLVHLAPMLRTLRVLLVVTVRDGGVEVAALRLRLERTGWAVPIVGLSTAELRQLVARTVSFDPGPDTAKALHEVTAGNPLFVAELARRLVRDDTLTSFADDRAIPIPPTVRAVLDERLAGLAAEGRTLLQLAAVVGQQFSIRVVAAAAGVEPAEALATMDEAFAAGIVAEHGPGDAAFAHPLLRSVLYDDIGVARRAELHHRVGEAIERLEPRPDAHLAVLAHHFLVAAPKGTAAKAARYSASAGRQAMRGFAYDEAVGLFDRALTANDLDPAGSDRGELLLAAADARSAAGDGAGARRAYLAVADNAREGGRRELLAGAALGLAGAGFEVGLFDGEQVALLEEALAAVGDDDLALRSKLGARLSVALSLAGQDARRDVLAMEAVRQARDSGDDLAMAAALAARCDAHAGPDHVHERARDAAMIVAIGHRRADHGIELLGRRLRLLASLEAGGLPAVDRDIHEFEQLSDWLRQPAYGWYSRLWRAARAVMRGRLGDQARLADEAERMGRAAGSPNVEILLLAHRHFVWLETADIDTYLAETERWAPPGSWEEMGVQMLPLAIMRPLFAGRPDEARAALDRSADALRHAPRDAEWLTLLAQVGDLCARLGGHGLVPWLYDTLAPYAELWSVDGIAAYAHGPVHRQLGTLAALLDRREQAAAHFHAALAANRAAGAELLVARTLFDRGIALGDIASLRSARTAYVELGVTMRVNEIDRLAGPRTASPAPEAHLFRNEGDVWALRFAGSEARVRTSKGMQDLARLLGAPGREIAAVDLVASGPALPGNDLGEKIDATARAAYKARLAELETAMEDADRAGDAERSAQVQAEHDALMHQLRSAYGLGGRPRRQGDPAERARTAVTARIRDAIRRIEAVHPELGRHLDRSVRTGTLCTYDPDRPVHWAL